MFDSFRSLLTQFGLFLERNCSLNFQESVRTVCLSLSFFARKFYRSVLSFEISYTIDFASIHPPIRQTADVVNSASATAAGKGAWNPSKRRQRSWYAMLKPCWQNNINGRFVFFDSRCTSNGSPQTLAQLWQYVPVNSRRIQAGQVRVELPLIFE
jgi:hypothetical protein